MTDALEKAIEAKKKQIGKKDDFLMREKKKAFNAGLNQALQSLREHQSKQPSEGAIKALNRMYKIAGHYDLFENGVTQSEHDYKTIHQALTAQQPVRTISSITLGPELEGKITERQAIDLICAYIDSVNRSLTE